MERNKYNNIHRVDYLIKEFRLLRTKVSKLGTGGSTGTGGSAGVQSITGTGVDNTDPANPVIGDAGFLGRINNETELNALQPRAKDTIYVPVAFTVGGLITFDAGEYFYNGSGWEVKKLDESINELDYCGINEFIHTLDNFHLTISHEGAGGSNKVVRVNGVGATFGNLNKASDAGNGVISFTGGVNGNPDRRGSTIETITQPGEYFEYVNGNTGQFDTQFIQINSNPASVAHANTGNLRFSFNSTSWTLFTPEGNQSGQSENATYRFTRTLYGWEVRRGNVVLYTSPEVCNNYGEDQELDPDTTNTLEYRNGLLYNNTTLNQVNSTTGYHRVSASDALPAGINITANITTGHDLTQATGMTLKVWVRDQVNNRTWDVIEVDVDNMLLQFAAGDAVDAFGHVFDNSYITLNVINPVTGEITFTEQNRDLEYMKSELWVAGDLVLPAYADDAAAGVAGLTANQQYQTDGSGASPLNVAGIVMVKQ